jgi:hypothetical protein
MPVRSAVAVLLTMLELHEWKPQLNSTEVR